MGSLGPRGGKDGVMGGVVVDSRIGGSGL